MSSNPTYQTVTEISQIIKSIIEESFYDLRIKGEISNLTKASSGHIYMSLKDNNAVIDAICWKGTPLNIPPENGMEVICTGYITTYPNRSKYQLIIKEFAVYGVGSLMKILEERKKKLAQEGIFNDIRKQAMPSYPKTIGIITSISGAVLHDMINRLKGRMSARIIVSPTSIQGNNTIKEVTYSINLLNNLEPCDKPEVIIIARGGGSIEDLWNFNSEEIVRAIANSSIPVISAIGHETDTTLTDYVADKYVPTPTAAIEEILPLLSTMKSNIFLLKQNINKSYLNITNMKLYRITELYKTLGNPRKIIDQHNVTIMNIMHQIKTTTKSQLALKNLQLRSLKINNSHYIIKMQEKYIELLFKYIKKCINSYKKIP